ncbi:MULTISPECIES: hypothetical protein [unclassified Streptomyces]|uniref:hypothetical protein n=1 Tax=unclassified Streptomyces TaxID=2593676 RepID=UPI0006FDBD61|nr:MULTISPECIES: hypothetical protein [unclassified Streptomyces]KQX85346.1 hypothetical protein ASD26_28045 [Streptomyces sp. Root1319]KQZ09953.1 hypothetical protein ASD51_34100 [Streptomyces sp. Root55]
MITPAQRLLHTTAERAAATVRLAEETALLRQMLAGVVAPVVAPLPLYVVIDGEQLHSVHATPGEAEQHAGPGMEIRPMTYRPGGGRS